MHPFVLVVIFVLFPLLSFAKEVVLKSGEHADFSRIVLQFENPIRWKFGRVGGNYVFRTNQLKIEFDLSQVFNFIPRSRIKNILVGNNNQLVFEVSCNCQADVFELREGRIVIDIKDGLPKNGSPFESELPIEGRQLSEPNNTFQIGRELNLGEIDSVSKKKNFLRNFVHFENKSLEVVGLKFVNGSPYHRQLNWSVANLAFSQTASINSKSTEDNLDILTKLEKVIDHGLKKPVSDMTFGSLSESHIFGSPEQLVGYDKKNDQTRAMHFPLLEKAESSQVNFAKYALIENFQRAAAQGLLRVPTRATTKIYDDKKNKELNRNTAPRSSYSDEPEVETVHIKVETILDRSVRGLKPEEQLTFDGEKCLPDEYFDVGSWGGGFWAGAPYDDLRANLLREFDNLDTEVLMRLVRRKIYLGFGAEANSLIKTFDTGTKAMDVLQEMADILDGRSNRSFQILRSQLSCQNAAAFWASLTYNVSPDSIQLDPKSVVRVFSNLPVHLRYLFGPKLVDSLIFNEDLETATNIRILIKRSSPEESNALNVVEAKLDFAEGNRNNSIRKLELVVENSGPNSPLALAELIEMQKDGSIPVRIKDAKNADALAVEFRGTETGNRLVRASIYGFSTNGGIQLAFDRIESAMLNGDISPNEAEILRAENQIANASKSTDEIFLISVFQNSFSNRDTLEQSRQAQYLVAERLWKTGFPSQAKHVMRNINRPYLAREKILLSEIALAERKPNVAEKFLEGIASKASKLMHARVGEMRKEFNKSTQTYGELGMKEAQKRTAWLGSNLSQIAKLGEDIESKTAKLILEQDQKMMRHKEKGKVTLPRRAKPHLSDSSDIVKQSKKFRAMFAELLEM